ncbi:hypothetical protein Cgig2_023334 [Carnegiea gigantea]|uniref:DUF4283 domain-containing protein n=1 Tax=Carnegiea gigantea TaxID=171969 RepID=A0A9Q1K3W0_9CARY|nr:hypothetical protein Cgig2_023334 [Carnegiea gigantea]
MAGELVDDWKRLSLTEAEDEIIEFEPEQGEEVQAQASLCLIRKVHTSNVFNPEALKQTMRNIWKPSHGLVIMDLDHNLFAFQFFSSGDMDYVLEEGPWAFDDHILLLKELDIHEQPSKIEFTSARFWVKIYDLPMRHVYQRCELYNPDVLESNFQYGSWLRATPTKKKAKDHEYEILQERHRLLGLRYRKQSSKAKARLDFHNVGPMEMHIDNIPIDVDSDISKKKKDEWTNSQQGHKDRLVDAPNNNGSNLEQTAEVALSRPMSLLSLNCRGLSKPQTSAMFPLARVKHLDDDYYDHLPILLQTVEQHQHRQKGRRCQFENFWTLDNDCANIIDSACSKPVKPEVRLLRAADLIDENNREGLSSVVTSLFLPVDAEVIMDIPLCSSWPWDSPTWHYSSSGELTIKSAYRLIMNFKQQATPGSSTALRNGFWKELRGLRIPPRMKTFIWRTCTAALPSKGSLSLKVHDMGASCELCRSPSETTIHVLFHYPQVESVRTNTPFADLVNIGPFSSMVDVLDTVQHNRKNDVAKQSAGFMNPEHKEGIACYFALQKAWNRGLKKIIVEGDCSNISGHLKKRTHPNTITGFILNDILCLANKFEFYSFSLVKRTGNRVAHALAYLQPFSPSYRIWIEDSPNQISDLALEDLVSGYDG